MPDSPDGGGDDLHDAATHGDPTGVVALSDDRARRRARWPLFAGLASAVLVLDQLTKAWIVANVDPLRPIQVVDDVIRLVYTRNTGALFGLFRDNATLFGLVSLGVIAAIVWYHGQAGRSSLLSIALGLLLGGALGNLFDRLTRGHVVDFVDAGIGGLRWYTFNVADAAVSCALLLLVVLALRPSLAGEAGPLGGGGGGAKPERAADA
jgi:signal peptidase II